MLVYHLDRSKTLGVGQIIERRHFLDEYRSSVPHVQLAEDVLFPNGLSQFRISHFRDEVRFFSQEAPFQFPMTLSEFSRHQEILSEYMRELVLDHVRRLYFPLLPSRYECIFCVPNIESIKYWLPFLLSDQKGNVVTLQTSEEYTITLDASILRTGFIYPTETKPNTMYGFSPSLLFTQAYKYWSGERSDNPLPETLVRLPAKVISSVTQSAATYST